MTGTVTDVVAAPPDRLLRADDVTVRYGGRKGTLALAGVSISVARGEILGVVGESGSGKSTLGRALAGFLPLTGGSVRLGEEQLDPRRSWGSRDVQMVFQDAQSALDPRWPVRRAVAEALRESDRSTRDAAADRLLAEVGIDTAAAGRRPSGLSGGQKQRVTIARALAARPEYLVCDEITSGLDVSIRGGVLNALVAAQREYRFGCVFISHDIQLVARLAHRIAVVYKGIIVEEGTARDITRNARDPYTLRLMESVPRLDVTPGTAPSGEGR
jgi:ABC-type dipeptide/oligopeptide/nickel transport system ATPase subunit